MGYLDSIISALSAIAGVLVGFGLKWLTSIGRVKVFLIDINIHYLKKNAMGENIDAVDYKDGKGARVYIEVDIHNTSGNNKVIRQYEVAIFNESHELNGNLGDVDTKVTNKNEIVIHTPRPFVITPSGIVNKRLEFFLCEEVIDLKKCDYYFTYRNNNNKLIKTKLDISPFV